MRFITKPKPLNKKKENFRSLVFSHILKNIDNFILGSGGNKLYKSLVNLYYINPSSVRYYSNNQLKVNFYFSVVRPIFWGNIKTTISGLLNLIPEELETEQNFYAFIPFDEKNIFKLSNYGQRYVLYSVYNELSPGFVFREPPEIENSYFTYLLNINYIPIKHNIYIQFYVNLIYSEKVFSNKLAAFFYSTNIYDPKGTFSFAHEVKNFDKKAKTFELGSIQDIKSISVRSRMFELNKDLL